MTQTVTETVISPSVEAQSDLSEIDGSLPTPLYHQIYTVLKNRITNGVYPFNTVLPGEQELCKSFGVSRITIKRALGELAAEGVVSRHRGRGTVVRLHLPSPIVKANFDGLLENLIQMGVNTDVKLLEFSEMPAPAVIAESLEIAEGDKVQHSIRLRLIEGAPFSYLRTYLPMDIAKPIKKKDLTSTPLLTLLKRSGVKVNSARQTITAVAAEPAVAGALELSVGAPVLKIIRVIKDDELRPVQCIVAFYRPDRYEYEMKLSRDDGSDEKL
ncbi:MAG: GntR family transcriptional regulator [Pseudomonadota bacterium]